MGFFSLFKVAYNYLHRLCLNFVEYLSQRLTQCILEFTLNPEGVIALLEMKNFTIFLKNNCTLILKTIKERETLEKRNKCDEVRND